MSKGDMRGTNTVIGRHTPSWFGYSTPDDGAAATGQPPKQAQPKPVFTPAHQAQIDKLRMAIVSADKQIATLAAQRDSDRADLLAILKQFNIPADKYPDVEQPKA
jgi:hypothetical protein